MKNNQHIKKIEKLMMMIIIRIAIKFNKIINENRNKKIKKS